MTFRTFIYKNAFRNKRRTALTVLSVGFSLFLIIALNSILSALYNPRQSDESLLRLAVRRSTSLADQLPLGYERKIAELPNVALVMPLQWFGGQYKEPKNFFANFAVDPERLFQMFPELELTDEVKKAFKDEKIAAIAGDKLMEKYGWKPGDRVTLTGTIFPTDLEFKMVGSYHFEIQPYAFYFHFDYLDEALGRPGTVGTFWVKAASPEAIPGIIEAVDKTFRNSPAETLTETEKAFQLGFTSMLGNLKVLMGTISGVIAFTMLLVSGSTMAMTIRERLREVAILKSIGYPRRTILWLIIGEAVFICSLGGLLGCAAAFGLSQLDLNEATVGFVQHLEARPEVLAAGALGGILIGLISGALPAIQASRMSILEALRRLN